MVHRREIDGEAVLFGNHGALYGNALTMFDHTTGSVWSQISGEALLGPLAGERLELVPSTLTDWGTWRREHPGTLALDADGGRSGFDVDDTHIAIEFGEQSLAVPVAELRDHGVANVEVAGVPVAVVAEPVPGGWWAVYSRQLDDRVVTLELEGDTLVEVDGPGRWGGVRGLPEEGDERLDPLGALTIFPRDFAVHFPDGQVWTP
jgi:hypothetical protein